MTKLSSPKDASEQGFFKSLPWCRKKHKTNLDDLKKLMERIMATQAELVTQLQGVKQALVDVGNEVTKVAGETDKLQQTIKDLQDALANQTNATPELVQAVQDVVDQAGVVSTGVKAVDDKVPDAP